MADLDAFSDAYRPEFEFSFDNAVMLPAYARRVTEWLSPDLRILDYGLGHGHVARVFVDHFRRHTVIEGSLAVISAFGGEFGTTELIHARFEEYLAPGEYDAAVLGFVLEHVDDPAALLHIAARNTRSGRLIIAVPNCASLHRRIGQAAGLLDDLRALSPADLQFGHQRFFGLESLRDLLLSEGFTISRVEGIFLKPLTTAQLKSLNLPESVMTALCAVGSAYPELCNALLVDATMRSMQSS